MRFWVQYTQSQLFYLVFIMSYNKVEFPKLMQTAGKITILTALMGVMVFVVAFIFDVGTSHLGRSVHATGTATTTLTVLNTPPAFTTNAQEVVDSTTTAPTNSGSVVQWSARAVDSNSSPYFLLVCSTNASPTASAGTGIGNAPPTCGGGMSTRWGVSAGTASGAQATVSTTTLEAMAETNNWYAWVCDDVAINPRCNNIAVQGPTSTLAYSSPFQVNHRPVLTDFYNDGPVDPSGTLGFFSTSSDPDSVGGQDNIYLVVCQTAGGINATTRSCTVNGLASTTGSVTDDATASYLLASIVRDDTYAAYGYLVDQHAHTATANPILENFVVNNVAPTLLGGDIVLNGGLDIVLTQEADETTGFTLDFTVRDANSCITATSSTEIIDYDVVVYRASYGTTTCSGLAGAYNPNYCYTNGVATTTWNLSCTVAGGSCTGATDDTVEYDCTFPLWFVADPTDPGPNTPGPFDADYWRAAVTARDDDLALSPFVGGTNSTVDVISFTALDLLTASIPYGALEPGQNTNNTNATTTVRSVGNTGLDQLLIGESMCPTFAVGNECDPSITDTVPEDQQKFSTTTFNYTSGFSLTLSSTTNQELELNVEKATSTSIASSGVTYWGIAVPASITLAGSYTGLNTFIARTAEAVDW